MRSTLARPFTLQHKSFDPTSITRERSGTETGTPMMEKGMSNIQQAHSHMRNPSEQTFFSRMLRSNNKPEILSLPFRLVIVQTHESTKRNVPYLRRSWNRIDFLSIVSFWIAFALATTNVERGALHIGIFRALSVMRIARLLAMTSGTTVGNFPNFKQLIS